MKDDAVYVQHILECLARIEHYTAGGRAGFMASPLIQDGVIRNLQTLGSMSVAAYRPPNETAWSSSDMAPPWR